MYTCKAYIQTYIYTEPQLYSEIMPKIGGKLATISANFIWKANQFFINVYSCASNNNNKNIVPLEALQNSMLFGAFGKVWETSNTFRFFIAFSLKSIRHFCLWTFRIFH